MSKRLHPCFCICAHTILTATPSTQSAHATYTTGCPAPRTDTCHSGRGTFSPQSLLSSVLLLCVIQGEVPVERGSLCPHTVQRVCALHPPNVRGSLLVPSCSSHQMELSRPLIPFFLANCMAAALRSAHSARPAGRRATLVLGRQICHRALRSVLRRRGT